MKMSSSRSRRTTRGEQRQLDRHRILSTVDSIPRGQVATYGGVAREAGMPRRARLVGRILSELPAGTGLPWHRVLDAQGRISRRGEGASEREQRRRLAREGVHLDACGRVDLERHAWRPG